MTIVFSVMMIGLFFEIFVIKKMLVIKEYIAKSVIELHGGELNLLDTKNLESIQKVINDGDDSLFVDTEMNRLHIISRTGVMEVAQSGLKVTALRTVDNIRANVSLQHKFKNQVTLFH